jgi:hypothetical protein
MKTARFVMIVLLSAAATAASAQSAASSPIDQDITLVGRDEAALPLPAPWEPIPFAFPALDMQRPVAPLSPPVPPPSGDWRDFARQAGYTYVGCAGAPPGHPIRETEIHSV